MWENLEEFKAFTKSWQKDIWVDKILRVNRPEGYSYQTKKQEKYYKNKQ